ncbi:MAG: hypothetical protein OEZ09_16245, partial [Betaproteobacteria bacterium]|nr:hypothetical protein [Betaproteobacteria bacterium]
MLWVCAAAHAGGDQLECGAVSVLPVPPDYAERCGTGLPPTELQALVPEVVPGDLAFYKANFPGPLELRTAPLPSLSFTTVGAQTRPLYAMAFDPFATNLYAVDDTTRELGRLDQTTGVFTSIGLLNPNPAGA